MAAAAGISSAMWAEGPQPGRFYSVPGSAPGSALGQSSRTL